MPPGIGKPVTEQDLQNQVGVQVTHAAFQSAEPETINQHLDKVYQPPKSEDIVQYADEDRMPTILFDDEMAKQIEANQQMWSKQTKHEKRTTRMTTKLLSKCPSNACVSLSIPAVLAAGLYVLLRKEPNKRLFLFFI